MGQSFFFFRSTRAAEAKRRAGRKIAAAFPVWGGVGSGFASSGEEGAGVGTGIPGASGSEGVVGS